MEVIVDHSIREFSLFASMLQMSPAVVSTTTILLPPTCQLRLCLPAPLRFDDKQQPAELSHQTILLCTSLFQILWIIIGGMMIRAKDHQMWIILVGCCSFEGLVVGLHCLFSLLFSQSQQTHGCCHEVHPTDLCFILQKLPCDIVSLVQCM